MKKIGFIYLEKNLINEHYGMGYPFKKKIVVVHSTFQSMVQNLKFVSHGEKQREMCAFVSVCVSGSQPEVYVLLMVLA